MDNVACTGTESGLIGCNFDNNTGDCGHSEDAGVRCFSPPTTGENSVYHELEYMSEEQYGFLCEHHTDLIFSEPGSFFM